MAVGDWTGKSGLQRLLDFAGAVLDLDAVLLSETVGAYEVVRMVSGDTDRFGIGIGTGCPLEQSYASRVVDGSKFRVLSDTRSDPTAADLPSTAARGVGAYIGAAVISPSRPARTLSGLSSVTKPGYGTGDGQFLEIMAHLVAREMQQEECGRTLRATRRRVQTRFAAGRRRSVFQPIVELRSGRPVGYEALTTFVGTDPVTAFGEAHEVGLGVPLEIVTIRDSLTHLSRLPADCYLSVKVSPAAACSVALAEAVRSALAGRVVSAGRVVVEITDHTAPIDYTELEAHLLVLRALGAQVEVGEVGAEYASLRDVLLLQPDLIKLATDTVHGIDTDPVRSARAQALTRFAAHIGARVVADGVGTAAERDRLVDAGLKFGQGSFFAPAQDLPDPGPLPSSSDAGGPGRRKPARNKYTPTPPGRTSPVPAEAKPVLYCPSCRRQLVRIDAVIDDRDFELRSCSHCDLRWWESDAAPASRATVLALMSASARGTR